MPSAPRRDSGCLVPRQDRDRAYDRQRGATPDSAEATRIRHTGRWHRVRSQVLRAYPLCVECARSGITRLAEDVDHIVPLRGRPDLAYDAANLQGLCRGCHNRKTARESRP